MRKQANQQPPQQQSARQPSPPGAAALKSLGKQSPVSVVSLTGAGPDRAAKAALARNPSPLGGQRRGARKASVSNQVSQQAGSPARRYEMQPSIFSGALAPAAQPLLTVHGDPKMISNRSLNGAEMADVIQFRLKQHHNEGTQANFETFSNFGNALDSPMKPVQPENLSKEGSEERQIAGRKQQPAVVQRSMKDPGQYGRLLDSRSSVLIPGSQRQDSKILDSIEGGIPKRWRQEEAASLSGSEASLPYNTDINVEKIQVRQPNGEGSPMRKAVTNSSMLTMGFNANQVVNEHIRRRDGQSQMLEPRQGPNRHGNELSPVIITSMAKIPAARKGADSLVFDVRSETPASEHRRTPAIGAEGQRREPDIETDHATNRIAHDASDLGAIQDSSPVRVTATATRPQVQIDGAGEPYTVSDPSPTAKQKALQQSARASSNFRGLNTMNLSLFEASLFDTAPEVQVRQRDATQISPIRQSVAGAQASQAKLMASLEKVAKESPTNKTLAHERSKLRGVEASLDPVLNTADERAKRVFRQAISEHEAHSKKRWRNMTPYERSKVLDTFARLQREQEARRVQDPQNPGRIQRDLKMCINVGEIRPGPNPHIKRAELSLGIQPQKGVLPHGVRFDEETLRDPRRIVKRVVKLQTQATIEDAEELSSEAENILKPDLRTGLSASPENSMQMLSGPAIMLTDAVIPEEPPALGDQRGLSLKEQADLALAASQFTIMPQKSVLHMRYPYNSDASLLDSTPHLQPLLSAMEHSLSNQSPEPHASTAMRVDSDANLLPGPSPAGSLGPSAMHVAKPSQRHQVQIRTTLPGQNSDLPVGPAFGDYGTAAIKPIHLKLNPPSQHQIDLPAVPEEQFRATGASLGQAIKDTLRKTETGSFRGTGADFYAAPTLIATGAVVGSFDKLTSSQEELLAMTQMSLQAISLTKRRQMAQTQVKVSDHTQTLAQSPQAHRQLVRITPLARGPAVARATAATNTADSQNLNTLVISPTIKQLSLAAEKQLSQNSNNKQSVRGSHNEKDLAADETLTDLKPTVQPQLLSNRKVSATARARVIRRDTNELEDLPKFVQEHTAKDEPRELIQLETRLKEYSGVSKVGSTGEASERRSALTHLQEPKLVKNFNQQAKQLQQLMLDQGASSLGGSSAESRRGLVARDGSAQAPPGSQKTDDVPGVSARREEPRQVVRLTQPSAKKITQVSYLEVLSSQRDLKAARSRVEERDTNTNAREIGTDNPATASGNQIGELAPIDSPDARLNGDLVATASDQAPFDLGEKALEEQSVNTHRLEHRLESSTRALVGIPPLTGPGTINVGASYTFYNEPSASQLEQAAELNDAARAKAASQMQSPKALQNPAESRVEHESSVLVVEGSEPPSAQKPPAPIAAETPARLQRNPDMVSTQRNGNKFNTTQRYEAGIEMEPVPGVDPLFDNSITAGFQETANFAAQANRSTGMPGGHYRALKNDVEINPLKQSFATTISVLRPDAGVKGSGSPGKQQKLGEPFSPIKLRNEVRPAAQMRKVTSTYVGGTTNIGNRLSHSVGMQSARLSSITARDRRQNVAASQARELGETSATKREQEDAPVFVDIRAPQGAQLLLKEPQVKASKNSASLGFAMSPLARRGQQVIAVGSKRRGGPTKTPLSKLLTSGEMAEFQRVLGQSKAAQSPGVYFQSGPAPREVLLNQVSTARLAAEPGGKAPSKLAMGGESPHGKSALSNQLSPLMKAGHQQVQSTVWKPVKVRVGPVAAESQMNDSAANMATSLHIEGRDEQSPLGSGVELHDSQEALNSRYGNTKIGGKLWQGGTMRSSRYLDTHPLEDVKMVGRAAVINQTITESNSKFGLSDLRSVISSKRLNHRFKNEPMIDSNSQTDLAAIPIDHQLAGVPALEGARSLVPSSFKENSSGQPSHLAGAASAEIKQINSQDSLVIAPVDSKAQLNMGIASANKPKDRFNRRGSSNTHNEGPASHPSQLSQIMEARGDQYTIMDDQVIRVAKGVLPRYKQQLSKKQQLAQQARQRYASPSAAKDYSMPLTQTGIKRRQPAESSHWTLSLVASSRNKGKERSSTQVNNKYFVFNDVKNWKQNLARHSHLISGDVGGATQRVIQNRTIDPKQEQKYNQVSLASHLSKVLQ